MGEVSLFSSMLVSYFRFVVSCSFCLLINAVRSCQDVHVGDEDSTAVLVVSITQQGRHPRPLSLVGRPSADNAGV